MDESRLSLKEVVQQGWEQLRGQFLDQLRRTIEGLLQVERDRRRAQLEQQGQKVYRWGYTVRKCWQTLWGALEQVRVPRLRGRQEIGLLEKYQRHSLEEVLFALTVGGLSQRRVVDWVRRFLGGALSPATLTQVLSEARQQVEARRQQPLSPSQYPALVVDGIHLRYRRRVDRAARPGVLLVALGVRPNGTFLVLDWQAAPAETTAAYAELFTRLWQRGLEQVQLIVSDGAEAITQAAAVLSADDGGNQPSFVVTVRDFGCGINPVDLPKVFEAFFTTGRSKGGSGLGLAIVHNLVTDALKATIDIQSEVGRGTAVRLAFPQVISGKGSPASRP